MCVCVLLEVFTSSQPSVLTSRETTKRSRSILKSGSLLIKLCPLNSSGSVLSLTKPLQSACLNLFYDFHWPKDSSSQTETFLLGAHVHGLQQELMGLVRNSQDT